ncbi:MAG: ribulose-phosphate 3-epimerase [Ruminococcaceae bacterium]|nr:ribulose-phosphate 3-epimerase [Oscillospiraceae bacterium]
MMIKISPSVLACDFTRLGEEVADIERAGADMVHLDVMDGRFVTNISFGLPIIEALRKKSDMVFDVHLMIVEPELYAKRFIDAGADIVTFHYEATEKSAELLDMIRANGAKAAISIKPNTPAEAVFPYLEKCDMVLVMTVEPGYGGQALIPETLDKVRILREEITKRGLSVDIQVDGGINSENAPEAINAGANVLVAGSSVFKAKDRKEAIDALRS